MSVNIAAATLTAKFVVAAGAIVVGALALGAPAAQADDADPKTTVLEPTTADSAGQSNTAERRKARVYIIGKTTKPHASQG